MYKSYASAMVTSTSTPGSILIEVICFTISEGECKSITLLWILIWNLGKNIIRKAQQNEQDCFTCPKF